MLEILKSIPYTICITLVCSINISYANDSLSNTQSTKKVESSQSQQFLNCINTANTDHKAVLNCIEQESKKQKIRLIATYDKIIADIPEAQKAKFKNLHTQLLDYVNKNCNISSNASSTSLSNKCDTTELQKKTNELENILKQYIKE
jgi:uncharacterized protein YecT (DUF1311 family)